MAKYNVDLDDNITVYYNYTPDHAHVYEDKIIKESTCTTAGTRQYICKLCGETYTEVIPKLDHKWNAGIIIAHPCTEIGIKRYTCTLCGETRDEEVPPTEHQWMKVG